MRDPHGDADQGYPRFIWGCPGSYWALEGFSDEEPDGYDLGQFFGPSVPLVPPTNQSLERMLDYVIE